jgi:hypothetical protein
MSRPFHKILRSTSKKIKSWFLGLRRLTKSEFQKSLWSGLIPSLLLGVAAFYGLSQTNGQLAMLQEQLSYSREPVIFLESRPQLSFAAMADSSLLARLSGLYISNVGNETAENVGIRFYLFMVTDSAIFSYGNQSQLVRAYFSDTTRSPRAMIWPRLSLLPNQKEEELTARYLPKLFDPYRFLPRGEDPVRELLLVGKSLSADCVLGVEYSYRRRSNLVAQSDTVFFEFDPVLGTLDNLATRIGGNQFVNRIRKYMENGPEVAIAIYRDKYVLTRENAGRRQTIVAIFPRTP